MLFTSKGIILQNSGYSLIKYGIDVLKTIRFLLQIRNEIISPKSIFCCLCFCNIFGFILFDRHCQSDHCLGKKSLRFAYVTSHQNWSINCWARIRMSASFVEYFIWMPCFRPDREFPYAVRLPRAPLYAPFMSIIIGFGTIGNETQIDAKKRKLNRETCRYKCISARVWAAEQLPIYLCIYGTCKKILLLVQWTLMDVVTLFN